MRIDLVSIFPAYFQPLELSLLGKAHDVGLVDVHIHDLRDWTHDRHRTVDDTPYGGGAGMVMKPDIWGAALDEILAADIGLQGERVLAIPTPSGVPLTQAIAEDLARESDHLVIACGRYEGIDQRVADHYRNRGIRVLEYSIGDYVLNGGEAAALVLVEAVSRLLDGFMGNPDSLAEESHSDGLLEYPAYTRPRSWRGHDVPDVLLGGNHKEIERWRRNRSLERTAARRPDLVAALKHDRLDMADREALVRCGWILTDTGASRIDIRPARIDDAPALAELAARTFPDACPDCIDPEAIAAFIAEELSVEAFTRYIGDPAGCRVLVAGIAGRLGGYTLTLVSGADLPEDMIRLRSIDENAAYLSKCYADSHWRGSGLAGALLEAAVEDAQAATDAAQIILGTHISNTRAQRFYKRHGFKRGGQRHFQVGGVDNVDVVLVRKFTVD